jgi:protein TonB
MTMKTAPCHSNRIVKMKIFFSISFLIHLAFFSVASILFLSSRTDSLPTLHVEVTLYPWRIEEKQVRVSIKKEEEMFPFPPAKDEVREHPTTQAPSSSLPEIEERKKPTSEALLLPIENKQRDMREKEEQVEKKPIVLASLNPETVLTIQREGPSEPLPSPPQSPSVEEETKQMAKYPSLSEGEIILIHPKYAENPKPLYPREARKKGFQGEVVLKVEVLSNGLVGQVEVKKSSGHEILDRSALSAVKHWKFFPATRGENAISSWVNVPIKFQLQ